MKVYVCKGCGPSLKCSLSVHGKEEIKPNGCIAGYLKSSQWYEVKLSLEMILDNLRIYNEEN